MTAALGVSVLLLLTAATAQASPAPGGAPRSVRVAVIMLSLPTSGPFSVTPAEVGETWFGTTRSVARLYGEASRGGLTVDGQVFGPVAVPGDDRFCTVAGWAAAALQAVTASGADLTGYTNFAYLFPRVDACPWAGMGDVGGRAMYINAPAEGDVGLYHAAHELGHNLGAGHAHAMKCYIDGLPAAIAPVSSCTQLWYGDPFTLMGSGLVRQPSAWDLRQMGLLSLDEMPVIESGDFGTYDLVTTLGDNPGARLLLVRRSSGGYLALEYVRDAGTFSALAGSSADRALIVRYLGDDLGIDSRLIDATPPTASVRDAMLLPGMTLSDPAEGLSITLAGADVDAARIQLGPLGNEPPTHPDDLRATISAEQMVSLTWSAPLIGDDLTYRILREGLVIANTAALKFTDDVQIAASTTYSALSVDASGAVSDATTVVIAPTDTSPPSRVARIRIRRVNARTVVVTWSAASDNVAVAGYAVRLGNGPWQSVTQRSMRFENLSRGSHRVVVFALDAAGNEGLKRALRFVL